MTTQHPVKTPRKLIEVALPLDAINIAAAREKSIRQGHPSTLHLWWARRPLAAARAVIFGQIVNDPSWKWELEHPDEIPPNNLKASWAASRKRLFLILEDLVKWENTTNEGVLEKARAEIRKSWRETCEINKDHPKAAELFNPDRLPAFHDPFAGGGALPLEAQRLGLETYASDLNPVAVLINKAMIEIPPKFAGRAPINPQARTSRDLVEPRWKGAQGLAEDVRHYGRILRDEAQKRVGHIYSPVEVTPDMARDRPDLKPIVGQKLTVIAWLWARTVKSPNPAFRHIDVPLASTFVLSSKEGKEAFVEPVNDGDRYYFRVRAGRPPPTAEQGTKAAGRGANFRCIVSDTVIAGDYIKAEAQAGRMGQRLMAIVADGASGRVYLPPTDEAEILAKSTAPSWKPDVEFFQQALGFRVGNYGMSKWSDLFAPRQLIALTSFCDSLSSLRERIREDALRAGMTDDRNGLDANSTGATAYAEAVSVYLALALGKLVDYNSSLCSWISGGQTMRNTFGRQAVPMVWDFAEANPLAESTGSYVSALDQGCRVLRDGLPAMTGGYVTQSDAQSQQLSLNKIVSTDPPYYDNIGYADLSDFFYVWMRKSLHDVFPGLFATIAVPKAEELVATPARHGSKDKAESFFLSGMTKAMRSLVEQAHPAVPVTIYYAFKQSDTQTDSGTASTGWQTFLEAVLSAGLQLCGTWPMRTELGNRMRSTDSNALASSIVLVCRARAATAETISRRTFLRELNQVLPIALDEITKGAGDDQSPVAPVDLSQAIIGPGMAVFSKYAAVLEADGTPMSVRAALQLINRFLAEDDFDHDTQFCLHWFEQHGWNAGRFGDADTLARAKGTSVDGVKQAGVLFASGGIVRLLRWSEYPSDWDPANDPRLPVWEALHQIICVFKTDGDSGAGAVLSGIENKAESTRQLAYRLYTLCERAGWAEDARAYNEIVTSWNAIESAATRVPAPQQATLFG